LEVTAMDKYEPGDEVSHVRLHNELPLVGLTEKSIGAEKHKVKMRLHPKGLLLEHKGETHLIFDSAIASVRKAFPKVEKK
jgi:hypothetical protein